MNAICQGLFVFLRTRFPDVEDKIFEILVQAALDGRETGENLSNISQNIADELKVDFGRMEVSDLESWLAGVMRNKKGRYQKLLEAPMFEKRP